MNAREKAFPLPEGNNLAPKRLTANPELNTPATSQYVSNTDDENEENIDTPKNDVFFRGSECIHDNIAFVPTVLAETALEMTGNTHSDSDIGVLYGSAGAGKSRILREYARRNDAAILIEACPGYTARVLLQVLCEKLDVRKITGTVHELSERCIMALRGTRRVVLIDEAELLPHRALEVMRRIHDRSSCGLLLAGMPRLLLNLRGAGGVYEQLYSRVGMALDLDDAKLMSEECDFHAILSGLIQAEMPGYVMTSEIIHAFRAESGGNYRRAFKLVRGVIRASKKPGSKGVSVQLIKKYGSMLINKCGKM